MTNIETYLFKNIDRVYEVYSGMPSQKAESCGPYSILPILISYGFIRHNDILIDEDYLAYLARTRIFKSEAEERRKILYQIKSGLITYDEALKKAYKILYKYDLIETDSEGESGTSVEGVIHALETVSNNKLRGIPIPSRRGDKIFFTKESFNSLIDWILKRISDYDFHLVLNYRTSHLIDPTSREYTFFNLLLKWDTPEKFPKWGWNVGHFVGVNGFQIFRRDGKKMIYFIIRDTYKEYGFQGIHLQPLEYVRKALIRDDGREGGLLVIVRNKDYNDILNELEQVEGIEFGLWDNGSPF